MKAMILAVQVIEMVQGSAAGPHPKASREGDLGRPVQHFGHGCLLHERSPVPASYAKCGKAPEAEGDRASEEDMVAHADDGDGHDHEQAA